VKTVIIGTQLNNAHKKNLGKTDNFKIFHSLMLSLVWQIKLKLNPSLGLPVHEVAANRMVRLGVVHSCAVRSRVTHHIRVNVLAQIQVGHLE
jgi:hypothetical protein